MVPYVRKSFYKHFKDGYKYIYEENNFQEQIYPEKISIDSEDYKFFAKAYQYAIDMTTKELNQAVEGMYHNLEIWA